MKSYTPTLQPIRPGVAAPLYDLANTRRIEADALLATPNFTLMHRAGTAVARLARAIAPHARRVWVACGAGNNGGDGLEAAAQLREAGVNVCVSWLGSAQGASQDTVTAWKRACGAQVPFVEFPPEDMEERDLCIDALLGIGFRPGPEEERWSTEEAVRQNHRLSCCLDTINHGASQILAVDIPSGLMADTGVWAMRPGNERPLQTLRHTLSLLTLKPGLFTADGRDACGAVWLDTLGVDLCSEAPQAWLGMARARRARAHASHKGTYGDVCIIGGEGMRCHGSSMCGAPLLAARAALHAGAGRVYVALEDDEALYLDPGQPELMFRQLEKLDALLPSVSTVVCGCGGGRSIAKVLPQVLGTAARLVLDADALNAIAEDAQLASQLQRRAARKQPTVLTPHPLEAARLLGSSTAEVQADRLHAAVDLARRFVCMVVLKGSGSVIAASDGRLPVVNPTGNARLATAGTGDVLAGVVGAYLAPLKLTAACGAEGMEAVSAAVYQHGVAADAWSENEGTLTASALAKRMR